MSKRNGKGVWMRAIENVLKRFGASLEWLTERMGQREGEMDAIRQNGEMEEHEKILVRRSKKGMSVEEVLEEVEILIDVHHFNEFSGTKSSAFLKVVTRQNTIEMNLHKKTLRTLNCTPKTMKVIREIQENLLCRKEKGADHQAKNRDEVLVQQVRACAEREAHRELLQEGERRDQRPPRHCRQHHPEQYPGSERIDHP